MWNATRRAQLWRPEKIPRDAQRPEMSQPPKLKSFQLHRTEPEQTGLALAGRAYWWRLGRKIALMSAHSSTLLSLVLYPVTILLSAWRGQIGGGELFVVMLGVLLLTAPIGWFLSFLWSGLLSLVLLPCVYLSQRLFGEPIRRDTTGWVAGSTVAVVGSAGGLLYLGAVRVPVAASLMGAFGVIATQASIGLLGIAAAQAGGYLGSLYALRRRRREPARRPLRFTVWRLLAVTAILSVLLSVVRLAGEFTVPLIISVTVSSLLAWAIHRPVAWATNRWLDWRLRKRRARRRRGLPAA